MSEEYAAKVKLFVSSHDDNFCGSMSTCFGRICGYRNEGSISMFFSEAEHTNGDWIWGRRWGLTSIIAGSCFWTNHRGRLLTRTSFRCRIFDWKYLDWGFVEISFASALVDVVEEEIWKKACKLIQLTHWSNFARYDAPHWLEVFHFPRSQGSALSQLPRSRNWILQRANLDDWDIMEIDDAIWRNVTAVRSHNWFR